jgi:hypothetical protein
LEPIPIYNQASITPQEVSDEAQLSIPLTDYTPFVQFQTSYTMDSDLPEPPSSPPLLLIPRTRARKRHLEADFSSDGPTFSSDPTDPAIDVERRKRQYRGTWWSNGSDQPVPKSSLTRNFDSGIYLPSESSEDSIPKSDIENEVHTYRSRRLTSLPEPVDPLDALAEKIVNGVMEEVGDLVDME